MENMDLNRLSQRTGITVRKLRYVLDHDLLPFRSWDINEESVGKARTFDDKTGVLIACAAFLLEAGYKRGAVKNLLNTMEKIKPTIRNPLNASILEIAVSGTGKASLQLGDGQYVRWQLGQSQSAWFEPSSPAKESPEYLPYIIVELNMDQIRDKIRVNSNST